MIVKDNNFKLKDFEGPLDLLLHLIKKRKLDILEISLYEISGQYLEYVNNQNDLSLELAAEYLLIASTLLYVKSKRLLKSEIFIDKEYEEQKDNLIENLLEYEKFKKRSAEFQKRLEKNPYFEKKDDELDDFYSQETNKSINIISNGGKDIQKSLKNIIERAKKNLPTLARIENKRISIGERKKQIEEIIENNKSNKKGFSFYSILKYSNNYYIALSLLVILELSSQNKIEMVQSTNFSDFNIISR